MTAGRPLWPLVLAALFAAAVLPPLLVRPAWKAVPEPTEDRPRVRGQRGAAGACNCRG